MMVIPGFLREQTENRYSRNLFFYEITIPINSGKLKWYKSIPLDVNSYGNLWMHRWISLITIGYLDHECVKELKKINLQF